VIEDRWKKVDRFLFSPSLTLYGLLFINLFRSLTGESFLVFEN
jgi:hypothetical protein